MKKETKQQKKGFPLRDRMRENRISILVLAVAALVFAGLYLLSHTGMIFAKKSSSDFELYYETAEVLNVSRSTVTVDRDSLEGISRGQQTILVRVKSGAFAGQTLELTNHVTPFIGVELKTGDRVVIGVESKDGQITSTPFVENYLRFPALFGLIIVFLAVTVLVGGKTGLKSLLGLAFTVVVLIWIYCPLLMKGGEPLPLALGLCIYVEIVCFTVLNGIGKKTLCAMTATAAGMGLAVGFSLVAQSLARISSYSMMKANSPEIETLFTMQTYAPVHVGGLLSAGIVISSLGAVMDVAMSLSSSISELKAVNPALGPRELWRSGMRIGRDMVGTMTNTLILAFFGSGLTLILYMWAQDQSFHQFTNSNYLAVELITALSSSIGVILAVPLTALIGSVFFGKK